MRPLSVLIAVLVLVCAGSDMAVAQSAEETAFIEKIRDAEKAVEAAEAELEKVLTDGKPVLEEFAANKIRLRAAKRDPTTVMDEHRDSLDLVDSLKARIESKVTAWQFEPRPDETASRAEKAAHEEKIARIESELAELRSRLEVAKADRNRLEKEMREADAAPREAGLLHGELFQQVWSIKDRIREARRRLAAAQQALEQVRNQARWALRDHAPPILYRVRSLPAKPPPFHDARIAYHMEWTGGAEEAEELLRLAQYLHQDLGRTIKSRHARLLEWFDRVQADRKKAQEKLDVYTSMVGVSNDGALGLLEQALDKISWGYWGGVVAGGSMTWKKIGMEIVESLGSSATASATTKVPLHATLGIEAIRQIGVSVFTTRNPEWDVGRLPSMNDAALADGPEVNIDEAKILDQVTADVVRQTLEQMHVEAGDALASRAFQKLLLEKFEEQTLAAAFTDAAFRKSKPDMRPLKEAMHNATYSQVMTRAFLSSTGDTRRLAIEAVKVALPRLNRTPRIALGGDKKQFLALLQTAALEAGLSALEVQRLVAWNDYIEADIDARFSTALMVNEGRMRRLDIKIRDLLANKIIRDLLKEIEEKKATREPDFISRKAVASKTATVSLAFSRPVVVRQVLANGRDIPFHGEGSLWFATLPLAELIKNSDDPSNTFAELSIDAAHPAIADRRLDDPSTVATWSVRDGEFDGYEAGADTHHRLRLAHDLGPVGISVGKLIDEGKPFSFTFGSSMFFDDTAWIGIVPASVPRASEQENEKNAVWRKTIGFGYGEIAEVEVHIPAGRYEVRIYDDDDDGKLAAAFDFWICKKGESGDQCRSRK